MRALFVIILLAALVLHSGHTSASPLSDISPEELQTLQAQAAQGDANAQYNLGVRYDLGSGVPQDYMKAAQWYEKAAAQGDVVAQFNLGSLYRDGRGVPRDYKKAAQWFESAAAQGDVVAQFNLGLLYAAGQGVPQDYMKAYMWLDLAASQLTGDGKMLAVDNRDAAARRMTPTQLAEAQRLAQQCQETHFKGC